MKTILIFFALSCFSLISSELKGQQLISTAGGSGESSTLQLSWSVGEPVIETFTAGSNNLTQGFQQSRLTVTAVDQLTLPGLSLSVYPNPVFSELNLDVKAGSFENLNFQLFMLDGKVLLQKKVETQPECINMEIYPVGTYLLKVYDENRFSQTYKIVKN